MVKRSRGFTLVEVVVAMAAFGFFLFIIILMTAEMEKNRQRYPVNFMAHPQMAAVLSRMRRDVEDSQLYPESVDKYTQTPKTLIVKMQASDGSLEDVVWDFSTKGEAHRLEYRVGALASRWDAKGLPDLDAEIDAFPIGSRYATRIKAKDKNGQLAIDQLFTPRKH
ncbi:MAG: prepilin-type N-terminal cleavage/methylation domain-containing protein [Acidobacteria bacterium]|nr:prepilin-type N-terminal cleavage/methylation domain-containing protein [Acidobacteriota bacterium]